MLDSIRHRLFIGFHPPAAVIPEMGWIRDAFRSRRRVPDDQLHMTLLPFPLYPSLPEPLARHIIRILSAVELPSCRIIVDRLVLGRRSALLQPSEPLPELRSFQRMLAGLVRQAGLQALEGHRFSPHFTLFYDGPVGPGAYIDPISWTAEELVLVHSFHGQGRHETLARWPLTMRHRSQVPSRTIGITGETPATDIAAAHGRG